MPQTGYGGPQLQYGGLSNIPTGQNLDFQSVMPQAGYGGPQPQYGGLSNIPTGHIADFQSVMPQSPSYVPQEKDSIPLTVVKNPGDGSGISRSDSGPYEPSPPSNPISRRPTGGPKPTIADSTYHYQGYTNPGPPQSYQLPTYLDDGSQIYTTSIIPKNPDQNLRPQSSSHGRPTIIDSSPNWPNQDPNAQTIHDPDFSKYYTGADNSRFQPPITEFSDEYNSFTDSFPPPGSGGPMPISFPRQPNPAQYHRTLSENATELIEPTIYLT